MERSSFKQIALGTSQDGGMKAYEEGPSKQKLIGCQGALQMLGI